MRTSNISRTCRAWPHALLLLAASVFAGPALADEALTVFAAASLKTALDEAAVLFEQSGGAHVRISYGGSLALARQIEQGAPADMFAAADLASMDLAEAAGALRPGSRFNLLGNSLVAVAPRPSPLDRLELTAEGFRAALGKEGRIGAGEVNSVPAGKYAKAALTSLGLWQEFGPRLAMSDNVRAALAFVARGELPIGIVYASDAKAEPAVKIVARFAAASHSPIVYPFALTARSGNPQAARFLAFLRGGSAAAVFEEAGFTVLK